MKFRFKLTFFLLLSFSAMLWAIESAISNHSIASAQDLTPRLLKDINPNQDGSSEPGRAAVAGDTLYFVADDGVHGRELWKSDGTSEGTQLLKDILPGLGSSGVSFMRELNGMLLFSASDVASYGNSELWKSDGTSEGTIKVKEINATSASSPEFLVTLSDNIYFRVTQSDGQSGLWKTDGTEAGTIPVPIESTFFPSNLSFWNKLNATTALFSLKEGDIRTIWRFDSTTQGMAPILSFGGPNHSVYIDQSYTIIDGIAYFKTLSDGTIELWQSDGTTDGTKKIVSFSDVPYDNLDGITQMGNNLYFYLRDSRSRDAMNQFWKSDGTEAGTIKIADMCMNNLEHVNDKLVFWGALGPDCRYTTYNVWVSDGSIESTVPLNSIPFNNSNPPFYLAGGFAYFSANDDINGTELWRTDSTVGGTTRITDMNSGTESSLHSWGNNGVQFGDQFFFIATDGVRGHELWSIEIETQRFELSATVFLPYLVK